MFIYIANFDLLIKLILINGWWGICLTKNLLRAWIPELKKFFFIFDNLNIKIFLMFH